MFVKKKIQTFFLFFFIFTVLLKPNKTRASLGIDWTNTDIKFGTTIAYSVAYGDGKFVAVGFEGKASYSTDGISWTALPAGDDTGIKFGTSDAASVTYNNGKFLVVGASGKASYSTDGINWTALPAGDDTGIKFGTTTAFSVAYGDGKFVAVGFEGKASYSTDGINWTALPAGDDTGIKFGTSDDAIYVAYDNGKFLVIGGLGKASYSTDGINWTALPAGDDTGIKFGTTTAFSVAYGDETFVVVGVEGKASYSTDGISWTALPASDDTGIKFGTTTAFSVAYGDETFVVVGVEGKASYSISDSDSTPTPTPTPTPVPATAPASQISSAPTCIDFKPFGLSDLFQINTTQNTAKLHFTPVIATNNYFISFSDKSNAEEHGELVSLASQGVQSHTVYFLKPDTTYYFKVRANNGCMPGDWSNIMKVKTSNSIYYKNFPTISFQSLTKNIKLKSKPAGDILSNISSIPSPLPTEAIDEHIIAEEPAAADSKKCFLWWCW